MNKKLNMAVAGAVMAMGATAANAGITIPAGDWTVDIGGNVNSYYQNVRFSGVAFDNAGGPGVGVPKNNVISSGLLPSAIGIGAKTRQNDLDIGIQFTFFTGNDASNIAGSGAGGPGGLGFNTINVRQAFLTFGDKSWGTIKAGRDLGVFGGDAILSDMTIYGVGGTGGGGGSSTLGRIGSGYLYADWVGQISYWSPNWNGFSFAASLREPWTNGVTNSAANAVGVSTRKDMGFEGKVSYEWGGDFSGKVWLDGITQKHQSGTNGVSKVGSVRSEAWDIGGKVAFSGAELVGYYYDGSGMDGGAGIFNGVMFGIGGSTHGSTPGYTVTGGITNRNDDSGGYIQLTYKLPTIGTKLGVSWGESNVEATGTSAVGASKYQDRSWIVMAIHPLTKSLNLVAEYEDHKLDNIGFGPSTTSNGKIRSFDLGAILFF
jgi:predicted porin